MTIIVSGRVQGVFFRVATKEKADELGVKGFVRNELNGSVYMEAEAEEDILSEFIKWCKSGPPRAQVQHAEVMLGEEKGYTTFTIQR